MLKQSKAHKKLPANWQGHTPDYDLFRYPHYALDQQRIISQETTQARNRRTIARLQSALALRRQHSFIQ